MVQRAPPDLVVRLEASDRLNPADDGQSLPTVVRVYQLKSPSKMESADFAQLYRADREVLGDDLLSVEELTMTPGSQVERKLPRNPQARALAVVVMVRRPAGDAWRAVTDLAAAAGKGPLVYRLQEYRIDLR